MINSKDFTKRLQKIMEYHGISASQLADKISVQRSSISHILSGRNKPSLEFVMKVLSSFPDVDLYWLLNGKGQFPSEIQSLDAETSITNKSQSSEKAMASNSNIDRIVIFYKNGSFKEYTSE